MRRLLLATALLVLAGAASGACHGVGASPFPEGGRFLAERVAKQATTLINGPAWATYCPADSLLVIVALSRTWNGGLALRAVPPLNVPHDFRVQLALDELGTATVAFRAPKAGAANVGVGGTVRVAVTTAVNGWFDAALPDSGHTHVSIRGRLSRIPLLRLPTATCAPP
jgi:hypothetical protein